MQKFKLYIITVLFAIFALLEFVFLQVIPSKVNLDNYMPAILADIKSRTGIDGEIGHVKFDTFCDFSINFNTDYLKLKTEQEELLSAQNLNVRIYLLPLIIKHLRIRTLSADKLKVNIERTKDGKYNFNNIELDGNINDFDIKLSKVRLYLAQYDINFDDKYYGNKYKLFGDYFIVNKFKPNKFVDAYIIGNLLVNEQKYVPFNFNIKTRLPLEKHIDDRGLRLDIQLPLFDASLVRDYVKEYLDKELKQISGNLSLKIKTSNFKTQNHINAEIIFNDLLYLRNRKDMSVMARGEHVLKSKFIASDKVFTIKELSLQSDKIDVESNGVLRDYTNLKKVKTNLNVDINKGRSDYLYWILPSEIPTDYDMIRKVKNYGFYADVVGKIKVKGKGMTPDVLGKVDITQAYVTKPFAQHVPKADIFLEFMGKYVHVNNRSYTDRNEYVDVLGNVELYNEKNVDMTIKSTQNVDLVSTYQVLVPVHDVLGFELGPVPEMQFFGGVGNIDLIAKGNIDKPDLFGVFRCKNTTTSMNGLAARLTNSSAELLFNHDTYQFNTIDAYENGYPFSIKGNGNWQGVFDFNVNATDMSANEGFNIIKNSEILEEYHKICETADGVSGNIDLDLNLKGNIKVFNLELIKKTLEYNAKIIAKNVGVNIKDFGVIISKVTGNVDVSPKSLGADLKGLLNNANFEVSANSDLKNITMSGNAKGIDLNTFLSSIPSNNIVKNIPNIMAIADVNFSYEAPIDKLYPEKIFAELLFKTISSSKLYSVSIKSGSIKLKDNKLALSDILVKCFTSSVKIDGSVKNVFSKNIQPELYSDIAKLELHDLSRFLKLLPVKNQEMKMIMDVLSHSTGSASGNIEFVKNKLNGKIGVKNLILKSAKISQSIVFGNTNLKIKNNNIDIDPFTFSFYQVPVFLKISAQSVLNNPKIDVYSTAKINSAFFDEFVNNYLTYPIKQRGESSLTFSAKGNVSSPEVYVSVKVPQNSDIAYAGANLGDVFDVRELFFNAVFYKDKINLKHFVYKKYIDTQNSKSKPLQIIGAWGNIIPIKNGFDLRPLYIKTDSPASAKFFNILFKKSIIKNGNFSCNLKLNGNSQTPMVIGNLNALNVEMPTYNAQIKDLDVDLFQGKGDLNLRALAYDSEFEVTSKFKNSVKFPFEIYNIDIISKYINIDNLNSDLTKITYSDFSHRKNDDINNYIENIIKSGIIIHSGHLKAKDVFVKGLNAQNLDLNFSLNRNLILNVKQFIFDVAQGVVEGNISYNLRNTDMAAVMTATGVSAEPVVEALFMLKNQIYGKLNGKINVKTSGLTDEQITKNLNGNVTFEIVDGKMPKLGSLEYLLRASNLLESGITGVSINSVLQILVPLRTGDFSKLQGKLVLSDGKAKNIQIYTRGKSLNLYLFGGLDLISGMAQMEIWGKLDNSAKSPLGIIANASLNSLFRLIPWLNLDDPNNAPLIKNINKIPGIELSAHKLRIFRAIINGDINSDKFVEKFEWVKN